MHIYVDKHVQSIISQETPLTSSVVSSFCWWVFRTPCEFSCPIPVQKYTKTRASDNRQISCMKNQIRCHKCNLSDRVSSRHFLPWLWHDQRLVVFLLWPQVLSDPIWRNTIILLSHIHMEIYGVCHDDLKQLLKIGESLHHQGTCYLSIFRVDFPM